MDADRMCQYVARSTWPSGLDQTVEDLVSEADASWPSPSPGTVEGQLHDRIAVLYLRRYIREGREQDLVSAVERYERLYGKPSGPPAEALLGQAGTLLLPVPEEAAPEAVDAAAALFEAGADFATNDDERRTALRNAVALREQRYRRTGDLDDLRTLVAACERAARDEPADGEHTPGTTAMLGWCLARLRERTGDPAHGRAALASWEEAYRLAERGAPLWNKVVADAFNEAVAVWGGRGRAGDRRLVARWGVRAARVGSHDELYPVEYHAAVMSRQASPGALRDAARMMRATALASPPGSGERARRDLNVLSIRDDLWKIGGRQADVDAVIADARALLSDTRGVPADSLHTVTGLLAERLRQRHRSRPSSADLDEAVNLLDTMLAMQRPEDREPLLRELALSIRDRIDLGPTVAESRELARICSRWAHSIDEEDNRRQWMAWTGVQFMRIAQRNGGLGDLEAAITHLNLAVQGADPSWPGYAAAAGSLGYVLSMRFDLIGFPAVADLVRAQRWYEEAARSLPRGSHDRLTALMGVLAAVERLTRYRPHRDEVDDLAGGLSQELSSADEGDPKTPRLLLSLAELLERRHLRTGRAETLDEAVKYARRAVSRVHPATRDEYRQFDEPVMLYVLARLLNRRFEAGSRPEDRAAAMAALRRATLEGLRGNLKWGWEAARWWAGLAADAEDWKQATRAAGLSLRAAQRLYAEQPAAAAREFWLSQTLHVAADAAEIYVRAGDPRAAVTALERGRSVLSSAVLAVTSVDLDRLKRADAGLYARFVMAADAWMEAVAEDRAHPPTPDSGQVSFTIDLVSMRGLPGGDASGTPVTSIEEIHALSRRFAGARADGVGQAEVALTRVVNEVKSRRGFAGLFRAVRDSDLWRAAADAPLLYLSAGLGGGVGLLVPPSPGTRRSTALDVRLHPLPGLTREVVAELYAEFRHAYEQRHADAGNWPAVLGKVTGVLGELILGPMLDELGRHEKVRLVVTGHLGLLPVHASWVPDPTATTGRRYLLDVTTPSYALNARTVAFTREAAARRPAGPMLVVGEPGPAGKEERLVWSATETALVHGLGPDGEVVSAQEATRKAVTELIARYPVVHFNCHGRSEPSRPLDSALALADGPLRLRDLLKIRLPGARLAVLSACETATTGAELPDEVVGLAGGLIQAGVAGVVASAWAVPGRSTALLMARFHEGLSSGGLSPAESLRKAQRWVRDSTNGQKCDYLRDGSSLPEAAARRLWRSYALEEPIGRDVCDPVEWAAFALVGD
ncbi:CHAT domain-containing protein [Nonomuraea thailandensis]